MEGINFEKDIQPSIDALFSGKYDLSVKPKEESDSACNLSLLIRVLWLKLKLRLNVLTSWRKNVCVVVYNIIWLHILNGTLPQKKLQFRGWHNTRFLPRQTNQSR
jgi:hypothetical protein